MAQKNVMIPNTDGYIRNKELEKLEYMRVTVQGNVVVSAPPQRPPIPQTISSSPIWVDKHAPSDISKIAGNRAVIHQLDIWLKQW